VLAAPNDKVPDDDDVIYVPGIAVRVFIGRGIRPMLGRGDDEIRLGAHPNDAAVLQAEA